MRSGRVVLALAAFSSLVMLGCPTALFEYQNRTYKPNVNALTETRYHSEKYDVLGTVEATVRARCILGVYIEGTDGEAALMQEALKKYPRTTGLKDICAVQDFEAILPPLLMKVTTTYMGAAVSEK